MIGQFHPVYYGQFESEKAVTQFPVLPDLCNRILQCFAIDYNSKAPVEQHQAIKSFIEKIMSDGLYVKEYRGYTLILVDHSFFNFENDAERLAELFYKISRHLGINSHFINGRQE